ncbi:MAG TPA: glycosyltransferase [Bacillota bacterium]
MEKKKVLFFIYHLGAGGAARTMLNVLNHLDRTTFTPILVTLNFPGDYEAYLKRDVKFIKLEVKRLRSAIFPLAKVIRNEKPHLVFSTIPVYNTVAILARLFSFTRTKNIVREAAYLGGNFSTNVKLRLVGCLYRLSSQVISLSKGVKENLVKRYKVPAKKIQVIYNPVDLDNIRKHVANGEIAAQHQHIFTSDRKVIVTAGRLVQDKDQQTLIEACAKVNERLPIELVILGDGELKETLQRRAKDLHFEDHVHFIGFQSNPYIYFEQADVFALSSLREGFGHVLVEALATGTPVVSTNCKPGAAEVLNHGQFGKLCEVGQANDLAKAIVDVLTQSEEETKQMIQKGKQRAEQFAAKRIVKQYEAVFQQTIDERKQSRDRR